MADSKSDKKASKLKRKLSKKHGGNSKTDGSSSPPVASKSSSLPSPSVSAKSSTLPTSTDGGAMALHSSPSGGLFSKLKRRFRFGSKGKYDFRADSVSSLSTPTWLRRKSDETQLRHEKSTSDLAEEEEEKGAAVAKSNSVKTTRKTKSDKEEVILIRKDKRVSVICKAENGASEVIFSNVDPHSDEDLPEVWSGMEEDPYATISSVRDEINLRIPKATETAAKAGDIKYLLPALAQEPEKTEKSKKAIDDYPYARIDPNRKKKKSTSTSPSSPQASDFNMHINSQLRSRIEPDYETLDEVQQRKSQFEIKSNPVVVFPEDTFVPDQSQSRKSSSDMDPDYESLDDVKEKCAANALASSSIKNPKTFHMEDMTSPDSRTANANRMTRKSPDQILHGSSDFLPAAPIPQISMSSVSSSQEQKSNLSPSSISPSLSNSPSSLAPLAPSDDSTLLHDQSQNLPSSSSPQDQCLYDNPNVILRKQCQRIGADPNSLQGKRSQTVSEPPLIKTPAEEELVEKLSALLAPPLPMRNYQREEIHPKTGDRMTRSCGGSARHSWCSQASRNLEFGDTFHNRESQKSLSSSFTRSRENLRVRESPTAISLRKAREGMDSNLRKSEEILPMVKENNGMDSPNHITVQVEKSLKNIDADGKMAAENVEDKCDSDTPPVEEGAETGKCFKTQSVCENRMKPSDQGDVEEFSQRLAEKILIDSLSHSDCKSPDIKHSITPAIADCQQQLSKSAKISQKSFKSEGDGNLISNGNCDKWSEVCVLEGENTTQAGNELNLQIGRDEQDLKQEEIVNQMNSCQLQDNFNCSRHNMHPNSSQSSNLHLGLSQSHDIQPGPLQSNEIHHGPSQSHDIHHGPSQSNVIHHNLSQELPVVDTQCTSSLDIYKLQGARPKVKPLQFVQSNSNSGSSKVNCVTDEISSNMRNSSLCQTVSEEGTGKSSFNNRQLSLEDWDDIRSPSFCDIDFHDDVDENIPSHRECAWLSQTNNSQDGNIRNRSESSIQETLYLDSSDSDFDSGDENVSELKNGLKVHQSKELNLKRNLRVTLVAKPVVWANGRLVENLIGGRFKTWASLDKSYFIDGVFKWGRYFPFLGRDKQRVEAKMKNYFWFMRKVLFKASSRDDKKSKILQKKFDTYQRKIEKHLKAVQGLPTFQDVRMALLKTKVIDNWEPEKPVVDESELSVDLPDNHETTDESLMDLFNQLLLENHAIKAESEDGNHGEKLLPDKEIMENLCEVTNDHPSPDLPSSPSDIMSDFLRLSNPNVRCQTCGEDDLSDSEDEILTLNNYTKCVSRTSCLPSQNARIPHFDNASYCRAFHGELAYMARLRKAKSENKVLLIPGPDEECKGSESHLSWNSWCTADGLFKKLVPHISPRLDFQFLLKIYAEFKCFILKDRKRNYEHKGCYTKTFQPGETKCCRFEEFVFLKILRDELRYFSQVFQHCKASKDLFMEERDVNVSLLELLGIILRNIHKMRKSMSKEAVDGQDVRRFHLIHKEFKDCRNLQQDVSDLHVSEDERYFHTDNYENFRPDTLSQALKDWKSPQDFLHDPNVLITCRSAFAHTNSRSLEIAGMRETEEPKPLQEREDFLESMNQLQLKEWYWGPISYEQAAMILRDKEDGSFLVRDSSDQKYLLSLSFKSLGEIHHTRIEHAKGLFSFWSQPESHGKARICEFIEKSVQNSRDGRFLYFLRPSARGTPPLPIKLLVPVSRNFRVATLKHLSRFVVRQTVRKDHIDELPVPEKVKRYLRDKQYYVEIHDSDLWAFDGDLVKSS